MWMYEPQRTNLLTWSQDFSNAVWGKVNGTITPNAITAPDGTLSADRLVWDAVFGFHLFAHSITFTAGSSYVGGYFFKANTLDKIQLYTAGNAWIGNTVYANFDLTNGTIGNKTSNDAGVIDYGNGWYYCYLVDVAAASNSGVIGISGIESITDGYRYNFTGDGVSNLYIWNAQLEEGSYATSPIKTEGSTVTRVADSSSLTGLKAKGLIGATSGSIGGEFYGEELVRDAGSFLFSIGNSVDDLLYMDRSSGVSTRPRFRLFSPSINTTVFQTTQDFNKWLFAWDNSGWFLSVNSSVVNSGSEVFTFPTDNLTLNGAGGASHQGTLFMSQTKYTEAEATEYTSYNTYEEMAMLLGYTID